MRFYIEVERQGPAGTTFVTLRDGPLPKLGEVLRDKEGDTWTVTSFLASEVELTSAKPDAVPHGMTLDTVRAAHAA